MLACSVRPGISNNGPALLGRPRNPGTQRKESRLPHPQLPLELGQAELFTLAQTPEKRATKVSARERGGRPTPSALCFSTTPSKCGLPVLQSPDGGPGPAGLITHCDRLTSRRWGQSPGPAATALSRGGDSAGHQAASSTSQTRSCENQKESKPDRHGAKTDDNSPSRYHLASDPNPDRLIYSGGTSTPHFGAQLQAQGAASTGGGCVGMQVGLCTGTEDTDSHAHPKRCCSLSPACAQQASR